MTKFKIYNRSEDFGATKAVHNTKSEEDARDFGYAMWAGDEDITRVEIRQGLQFDYVAWVGETNNDGAFGWTFMDKSATAQRYVRKPAKAAKAKRHNAPVTQAIRVAQRQASGNATVAEYGARQPAKFAPVALNPTPKPANKPARKRDDQGRFEPSDITTSAKPATTQDEYNEHMLKSIGVLLRAVKNLDERMTEIDKIGS